MDTNYIGTPTNFRRIEGQEFNSRNTFDLNGTENDEVLKLYLRSAGLSDEIERLNAEQRRAFIYDIIRSNKLPGYWLPSTYKNSSNFTMQRPTARPPPPPMPTSGSKSATNTPQVERKTEQNAANALGYGSLRSNASAGSLLNWEQASPILPQRFVPAPSTPPSPSTFITSAKGKCYEISGPMNFQHTAGDMTRDRTRNAFDLSASSNDNVLRKYMMERGITEEDVAGIRKTDLIRKIVQSQFTWMPKNKTKAIEQQLYYATVHRNHDTTSVRSTPSYEEIIDPPPPLTPPTPPPPSTKPALLTKPKTDFSNYTLITSRFADASLFPTPEAIYGVQNQNKIAANASLPTQVALPPLPPGAKMPSPPPRKSQRANSVEYIFSEQTPPPPSAIKANNQTNNKATIYQTRPPLDYDNAFASIPKQRHKNTQQQPNSFQIFTEPLYITKSQQKPKSSVQLPLLPPPPMPEALPSLNINNGQIRRSVMPAPQVAVSKPSQLRSQPATVSKASGIDLRLSRAAVVLQKPTSSQNSKNGAALPPPPPPPPPPPMPLTGAIPPPPPPPPPPMFEAANQQCIPKAVTTEQNAAAVAGNDGRDALLESIRKGVSLKKVDQKAATISGVKPRAERKPQIQDFLSELKMGLTLRRGKNPNNNSFSEDEPDESQA